MIAFCPECQAGEIPDPLVHMIDRCRDHHLQPMAGLDDAAVNFSLDSPTEAEQSRALCRVIHRDRPEGERP